MKIVDKPIIYRTIQATVEHKGKQYDVIYSEDINGTEIEIWELDSIGLHEKELDEENGLWKKILDFFERETEDIEQFN